MHCTLCRLWLFATLTVAAHAQSPGPPASPLTAEQLEWARGRTVRVGSDPSFAPFSEVTVDGVLHGVDARVLETIALHTGLKFTQVKYPTWSDVWEAFLKGEIDMVTGCAATPERVKSVHFSLPYASPRLAIITGQESEGGWTAEDLDQRNVAIPLEYALAEDLRDRFPSVQVSTCQTSDEALQSVEAGRADATVLNLASAVALLPQSRFRQLRVAGFYDREFPLRLAVQSTPEGRDQLLPILNSALTTLKPQAAVSAYTEWVDARLDEWSAQRRQIRNQRIGLSLLGVGAALCAAAAAASWARRRTPARTTPTEPGLAPPGPSTEPLLSEAFELTRIPILLVQFPDLILERNAAARSLFNGTMVLPPEIAAVTERLATLPPETPATVEWGPPDRPPTPWQARLLPLPDSRCLLTLIP